MNTPVSFELAKLLKEKEYNKPTLYPYLENGVIDLDRSDLLNGSELFIDYNYRYEGDSMDIRGNIISAPTITDVVMWLYEKHRIWIELTMGKDHTGVWFDWDIFSTITPRKDDVIGEEDVEYEGDPSEKWLNYGTTYSSMVDERFATMDKESCSSPAEAYEAAIEYILNKLV